MSFLSDGDELSFEIPSDEAYSIEMPPPDQFELAVIQGPIGPRGPQGVPGAGNSDAVEHVQSSPSASWTIDVPESMNRRPSVAVYIDDEQVDADVTVTPINVNIQFPAPVTGSAVLT